MLLILRLNDIEDAARNFSNFHSRLKEIHSIPYQNYQKTLYMFQFHQIFFRILKTKRCANKSQKRETDIGPHMELEAVQAGKEEISYSVSGKSGFTPRRRNSCYCLFWLLISKIEEDIGNAPCSINLCKNLFKESTPRLCRFLSSQTLG